MLLDASCLALWYSFLPVWYWPWLSSHLCSCLLNLLLWYPSVAKFCSLERFAAWPRSPPPVHVYQLLPYSMIQIFSTSSCLSTPALLHDPDFQHKSFSMAPNLLHDPDPLLTRTYLRGQSRSISCHTLSPILWKEQDRKCKGQSST